MGLFKKEVKEIERLTKERTDLEEAHLKEVQLLETEIAKLKDEKTALELKYKKPNQESYKYRESNIHVFYKMKKPFNTDKENKLFEELLTAIDSEDFKSELKDRYFVFPKVRLADIFGVWNKTWENFKEQKHNYANDLEKIYPDINDEKYKKLILYPLFRLHIDFLICRLENGKVNPVLAIELNGKSHDVKEEFLFWNDDFESFTVGFLQHYNDDFKQSLFNKTSKKSNGVRTYKNIELWTIRNEELDGGSFFEELLPRLIYKINDEIERSNENKRNKELQSPRQNQPFAEIK